MQESHEDTFFPEKLNSFRTFWEKAVKINNLALPSEQSSIQSLIQGDIQKSLLPFEGLLLKSNQVEEFSKQVSDYVNSDEVIRNLSAEIAEPLPDETEEEFIERASQILRNILSEKFRL